MHIVHILYSTGLIGKRERAINISFLLVPGLSSPYGLAFALQPNDSRTINFTLAILRLQENHFLEDLYRKWWQTSDTCSQEENARKNVQILYRTILFQDKNIIINKAIAWEYRPNVIMNPLP